MPLGDVGSNPTGDHNFSLGPRCIHIKTDAHVGNILRRERQTRVTCNLP